MRNSWIQNLLYMVGAKAVPAQLEKDGSFTASEGHSLCEVCNGCGDTECNDCGGSGTQTRECDLGHEHESDCNNCEGRGRSSCFECDGFGETLDPDLELDEEL